MNKLLKLDELILEQYQKITESANKNLGWTKFNLARLAGNMSALSYGAAGVYTFIHGAIRHDYYARTIGGLLTLFGINVYYTYISANREKEEKETKKYLASNAILKYPPKPSRPLVQLSSLLLGYCGVQITFNAHNNATSASGLFMCSLASAYFFDIAKQYFEDTTFYPPTANKLKNFVKVDVPT